MQQKIVFLAIITSLLAAMFFLMRAVAQAHTASKGQTTTLADRGNTMVTGKEEIVSTLQVPVGRNATLDATSTISDTISTVRATLTPTNADQTRLPTTGKRANLSTEAITVISIVLLLVGFLFNNLNQ